MKDHNVSLARLSSFITWMFVVGSVVLLAGLVIILIVVSSDSLDTRLLLVGTALIYLGAGAIGIAAVSAFWRQIAKVIVDGLGGNLYEYASGDSYPQQQRTPSNTQGYSGSQDTFGSEATEGSLGVALTPAEDLAHKAMGSPELSAWGGSVGFSKWLKSLETPN